MKKPLIFKVSYEGKPNANFTDAKEILIEHEWKGEITGSLEITPLYVKLDVLDYSYSKNDPERYEALNFLLEDGFGAIIGVDNLDNCVTGFTTSNKKTTSQALQRAKMLMLAYEKEHPGCVEFRNLGYERTYEAELERELDKAEMGKGYSTKKYGSSYNPK